MSTERVRARVIIIIRRRATKAKAKKRRKPTPERPRSRVIELRSVIFYVDLSATAATKNKKRRYIAYNLKARAA